jgi:predicted O-linked N-acetylglucosamine transferase (SPINDLY family)
VYSNLGNALCEQRRFDEAIVACHRAIALEPDFAQAYYNLGNALREVGRLDEAIVAYDRVIALKPEFTEAHNNLGNALREVGRLDEALAAYRRAIALEGELAGAHSSKAASNLLYTLHFDPDYDAQALLAEHRQWARQYAAPLAAEIRPHPNNRTPDRRLRIGYLSPDFRAHPVGQLVLPLFVHHDRRQTEIIGYCDVRTPDAMTRQLETLSDAWQLTVGLSDSQVADRIRADRIDILVDLALHTADNRMLVFARKPAPVQVSMLGTPSTTGLDTIDYRLTDPYFDPPGVSDGDYTERSIRLPCPIWCYQAPEAAPPVGELPAWRNGFVTFGCLNQFAKVSRPALHLWVQILQALSGARLVLQAQRGRHLDAVRQVFAENGVAGDRVAFAARVPHRQYLERYHELDLCLDPFPYNGHTSTLDALWMGVPVVTLAGHTGVGRAGVSVLSNVGLPELIAATPEQYVAIATALAGDWERLSQLRAGLRQRMQESRLTDGPQYTVAVEKAFRQMWQIWCRSES